MSQKIADALGIRYCGEVTDKEGKSLGSLYNDDHGCKGSFALVHPHDSMDAANALVAKRKEFEACNV